MMKITRTIFAAVLFFIVAVLGGAAQVSAATAGTWVEYPVGNTPTGITFDSATNSVWTANFYGSTISKVDIFTGTRVDYAVGGQPYGIVFEPVTNSVWVSIGGTVSKINAFNGAKIGDYAAGGRSSGIAFDSITNSVWVANYDAGVVSKIDIFTGTKIGDYAVGSNPQSVAFDPVTKSVWVVNNMSRTVSKVDIFSGSKVDYPTGGRCCAVSSHPYGIVFDPITNSVWVTLYESRKVAKIDIFTGNKAEYTSYTNYPFGITFDPTTNSVWVAHFYYDAVKKLNIFSDWGTSYLSPTCPSCGNNWPHIVFDPVTNSVWETNGAFNKVSKISTGGSSGTIVVSSNVASSWSITGPTPLITGSGTSQTTLYNPAGTYTITWGAVGGYATPASQSLTLAPGGTITFNGTYAPPSPPTIAFFDPDQTTISINNNAILYWNVFGGAVITCNSSASPANPLWSGAKPLSDSGGFSTSPLTSNTTFTLTCSNAWGSDTKSTSVAVNAAKAVSISPLTSTIILGQTLGFATTANFSDGSMVQHNLNWRKQGGCWNWEASCPVVMSASVTNWSFAPTISHSFSPILTPNQPGVYEIQAAAYDGTSWTYSDIATITVNAAPTFSFYPSSNAANIGSTYSLFWNTVIGATSCTASDDWSGGKTILGGTEVMLAMGVTARKHTLSCVGPGGTTAKTVWITPVTDPPMITWFAPDMTPIAANTSTDLYWNVSGLNTTCTGSGWWSGTKNSSDGVESTGPLTATTAYTLTCSNSAGSDTKVATVVVTGGASVCGNAVCESGENPLTCARDCKVKYRQF